MLVFTAIYTSRDNSVSRLGHGLYDRRVMVQVLAEVNGISLHYIQTTSRAHPAGLWALSLSLGLCSQGMKLPLHFHVMPRLRMCELLTPCPPHACMVCTGTVLQHIYLSNGNAPM